MIRTSLHPLDVVIIVLYLAMLAGVGVYFSRRQKTLDEYFLAKQSMAWLPVGLSLMAALDSAIDYLMQPSATIRYGLFLLMGTSSWLFLYPWVAKVTLPFYRRLNYFTAYEYLEARFDVRVRALAAVIFIVWRLGWMATAIYVPSLAISTATGGRLRVEYLVIVLGAIVTLYTMLGGIEAVIWNDVAQFCVRFGGLAAVVAIAAGAAGGFSRIWTIASAAGKTSAIAPVDFSSLRAFFYQPLNVVAIVVSIVLGRMASYTSDQIMVQRLQTTKSLKDARQAFIVNAAGDAIWMFALSFVGLALFAFFQSRPLPRDFETDKILPYFMSMTFPVGIVGLVIASIMAASLSSVDSAINSCTSVLVIDIYNRLIRGTETVRQAAGKRAGADTAAREVFVSRIATAGFGVLGTILAMNVSKIGSLLEIANKLINAFSGPLFGIYILAMFSRRATAAGALVAGVVGSLTSYYVAYMSHIGFMWPATLGCAATVAVGLVSSIVVPGAPSAGALQLTWWSVMAMPEPRPAEARIPTPHG
jgi:SSS family transporter